MITYTYEVDPVRSVGDNTIEKCAENEAECWGLYRRPTQGDAHGHKLAEHIADFKSRAGAEKAARLLEREEFTKYMQPQET